jgi:hypothetical protein
VGLGGWGFERERTERGGGKEALDALEEELVSLSCEAHFEHVAVLQRDLLLELLEAVFCRLHCRSLSLVLRNCLAVNRLELSESSQEILLAIRLR